MAPSVSSIVTVSRGFVLAGSFDLDLADYANLRAAIAHYTVTVCEK